MSVSVAAAMSLGVACAQAHHQPGEVTECSFGGLSGHLNPPIPNPPGGVNQTGTYEFSGDGSCTGSWGATVVNITSNGAYRNIVCGTGWAADYPGNSTRVEGDFHETPDDLPMTPLGYEIKFAAGRGVLNIGGVGSDPFSPLFGSVYGGPWSGAGEVTITPENPNGCRTEPVHQFVVAGEFTVVRNLAATE